MIAAASGLSPREEQLTSFIELLGEIKIASGRDLT